MATPKQRAKSPATPFPVPQSREQVDQAIARIGALQRDRVRIHADKDEKMALINQAHKERLEPMENEIRSLQQGIQIWCESRRDELTQAGKVKHHDFPAGTIKWRLRPPRVVMRSIEAVLDALFQRGLDRLIRTRQEINKEAILAEPETILGVPGIKIEQGEDFVVEPFETKLEEVA
ncbi:MAG: host-nuclease inhibitor Gam family protein [Magnetococcus sp. MYC-9]